MEYELKSFANSEESVARYAIETFQPSDPLLTEIRQSIVDAGFPPVQVVSPMDGLHLEVLTRAFGAKKAVEIGTLGGYSGVCIARNLQEGGCLYAFEKEEARAELAKKNFERANMSDRTQVFVGTALDLLPSIESEGPFDLVFIDADKHNYPNYLDWAAKNLRSGGVVLGDNTFAFGTVGEPRPEHPNSRRVWDGITEFNKLVAQDGRFKSTILPTGEGLTLGVRK